jgi:hypothetical protein
LNAAAIRADLPTAEIASREVTNSTAALRYDLPRGETAMANARTRYDTICDYLVRTHEATVGYLYGKPCAMIRGHAFIVYCFDGVAFRMRGRVRLQASALSGARYWDPLGRDLPSLEWIFVPEAHFLRWDRFALESARLGKEGFGRDAVRGIATPEPAALDPAERSVRKLTPTFSLSKLWSLVPVFGKSER